MIFYTTAEVGKMSSKVVTIGNLLMVLVLVCIFFFYGFFSVFLFYFFFLRSDPLADLECW